MNQTLIRRHSWENESSPRRCVNTAEGLTRSSVTSREGLGVEPTSDIVDRFAAKVTVTADCWQWTGAKLVSGYGYMYIGSGHADRRKEYAHRVSYMLHHGPIPDGMHVDHICRNTSCVKPAHLRLTTPKQNAENRGGNRNNTSGARGVTWDKRRNAWRVQVKHQGVNHNGGRFDSLGDAVAAAKALRVSLFTHSDEQPTGDAS